MSRTSIGGNGAGLAIAFVLAIVAGVFVFLALRSGDDESAATPVAPSREEVVRAVEDIPAGVEITGDMVAVEEITADAVLSGAYTSTGVVVGQTSRIPIYAGEQVVPSKIISASALSAEALSFIVPEGMRAMAVTASPVSTGGGLVRPGDHVDVVVVVEVVYDVQIEYQNDAGETVTETEEERHYVSVTAAQNIEVLAVEQSLQQRMGNEAEVADGTLVEQPEPNPEATVVTLALTPEQTQAVFLADNQGALRLAIRGRGDDEIVDLSDTTALSLVDEQLIAAIREAIIAQQEAE